MKARDSEAIRLGTPGFTLMERAGEGLFREMIDVLETRVQPRHRAAFAVVAGKGNNGGDGYVVARCLAERTPCPVTLYSVCPVSELSGEARAHAERLPDSVRVVVCGELPAQALASGTVIVDALLGTGISGPLRPPYDRLIAQINASGCPVVAVDIPSGLNGDDGSVATDAVIADLTVTMAFPKTGLFAGRGPDCCGLLRCVDIGFPAGLDADQPGAGDAIFAEDIVPLLGRRPHGSHKNMFGHVLVLGGSKLYGGAPVLAGEAALRVGCGLVTIAVPDRTVMACAVPGALIVRRLPDDGTGFLGAPAEESVGELADGAQAVIFGPGLGPAPQGAAVLKQLLAGPAPLVVDADGLRVLASEPGLLPASGTGQVVLTPHPGEMRRLMAAFELDGTTPDARTSQACALADKTGAYVILKGARTVVAAPDGRYAVNTSGSVALATAGTGDVLSGILGGLLATGMAPWDAVRLGVFLHGRCVEVSPLNGRSLIADDVVSGLQRAISNLTPFD
jgi:NAD(P)H-hydrate epimerase